MTHPERPEQTPVDEATVEDPAAAEPAPAEDPEEHDDTGNAEAAKYRRRLREVEADRAALAERLDRLQRAEVERLAADRLAHPADYWLAGPPVADLLDDAGNVDPGKVTTAVDAVVAERPTWAAPPPRFPSFDGGVRTSAPPPATWADVLSQGRRDRDR